MTEDEFRRAALSIPGSTESAHMNHPDFRLGGKIFASLGAPNAEWGMVKLTPAQQRNFVASDADAFQPASGAWGRSGCTMVRLSLAKKRLVQTALLTAAENVEATAKPSAAKAKKPGTTKVDAETKRKRSDAARRRRQ